MVTNLDIWAIQYYPECLETALDNIKDKSKVFLLRNCMCNFSIGANQIATRQFDTALYSEDSDLLVMLMKDGKVTDTDIIQYLKKKNIEYLEKDFGVDNANYQDGDNIPEVWFIREEYVLEDALQESRKRKINTARFYNQTKSILILSDKKGKELLRIEGKGLIQLEDKIGIIVNHGFKRNMSEEDVERCIINNQIGCEKIEETSPDIRVQKFSNKILNFVNDEKEEENQLS